MQYENVAILKMAEFAMANDDFRNSIIWQICVPNFMLFSTSEIFGWIFYVRRYTNSERVIVVKTPNEQFVRYIMTKTSYIQWNDEDDVCFVLDQHT
jgi:hypothetical protein